VAAFHESLYLAKARTFQNAPQSLPPPVTCSRVVAITGAKNHADFICNEIVAVLTSGANLYVPRHHKNFYKFLWDQE
jgi:hypothetical protein